MAHQYPEVIVRWNISGLHNTYGYMWVHNRGINLNFVILPIHVLHKIVAHNYVHVWRRTSKNVQHLYLYDSIIRLYGISIILGESTMNFFSFPCLIIHACMEEAIRDLEGVIELRMMSLLAYGCKGTPCTSLWRLIKWDVDGWCMRLM